ncbi:MAG: hypothetical protein A4E68_00026 [Syntrophaceae bacterium PtaB.Bin095]|nr:MAG: hypothetical protein A4E68_00026 [Syntrophaceae bacterium PtaB.Bin095]
MVGGRLILSWLVEYLAELLDLGLVVDLISVQFGLKLVKLLRLRPFADDCLLVVGLEGLQYLFGLVDEVENKGIFLARVGTVEPREGLDRLDSREPLVHVHGMKKRLVEPRLVFLRHKQHLVRFRPEAFGKLLFPDAFVHSDFRILHAGRIRIGHRAGEGNQSFDSCIPLLGDVLVECLFVLHRVQSAGGDHHRLCLSADLVHGEAAEMLDHDLSLLGDVVGMETHEAGKRPCRLAFVHLGIVFDGFDQPVIGLVRGVVLENVEDETLVDGLTHAVEMKRLRLAVRAGSAEDFQRLILGCRGEGEEADIWLAAALGHGLEDFLFVVGQSLFLGLRPGLFLDRRTGEHALEFGRRLASLRTVRLVHDHRVPAHGQIAHLFGDEWELL